MGNSKNNSQKDAAIKRKVNALEASLSAARGEGLSVESLSNECNFANYLKLLKGFAQRYCVIVVASDTPWGPPFTQELTGLMMDVGFKVDLYGKVRCAYAAVIDSGELIFEKLENDTTQYIDETFALETGDILHLESIGYDSKVGLGAKIDINDIHCLTDERNLYFVCYDKITKTVLDAVTFDVWDNLKCVHQFEYQQAINSFFASHPGVLPVGYYIPQNFKKAFTQNEEFILENGVNTSYIKNSAAPISVLNKYYDNQGIKEVLARPKSYYDYKGIMRMEDTSGKYVNILDGHRVTAYYPASAPEYKLYMIGDCRIYGTHNSDEHTIESFLQKKFNNDSLKVKVENYGTYLMGLGDKLNMARNSILNSLPVKAGDIVLIQNPICGSSEGFPTINLSDIFSEPHTEDFFADLTHFTPDGNRLIAEKLFEGLVEQGILDKARQLAASGAHAAAPTPSVSGFDQNTNAQLAEYKRFLTDFYNSTLRPTIGAAVMNCNPFTLGHRYLIEKALEQCDYLIVFAVEEDKSVFPFEDRLRLIDEGTKDLPNVVIIPSGKFVLSSLTFSEYFNKSEMQDRVIDTSLDVTVFAREIAPCLNITKRFAGEEPFDSVTRQYNETMRRVLPEYGIDFVEIPRAEISGAPVSASRVRELLDKRDFDSIEKLVPESTLRYLMELVK